MLVCPSAAPRIPIRPLDGYPSNGSGLPPVGMIASPPGPFCPLPQGYGWSSVAYPRVRVWWQWLRIGASRRHTAALAGRGVVPWWWGRSCAWFPRIWGVLLLFHMSKFLLLDCCICWLQVTVLCMCRKGLRGSYLSTDTKVRAGYNAWIPTEPLMAYTLCWHFVFFKLNHFPVYI